MGNALKMLQSESLLATKPIHLGATIEESSQEEKTQNPFFRGLVRGYHSTLSLGAGVGGLVGDTLGIESVRDWGFKNYLEQSKQAESYSAKYGDFFSTDKDIGVYGGSTSVDNLGRLANWSIGTMGELLPFMVSAGIGGAIGRATAGTLLKKGLQKKILPKILQKRIEKVVAKQLLEHQAKLLEKGLTQKAVSNLIAKQLTEERAGQILAERYVFDMATKMGVVSITGALEAGGMRGDLHAKGVDSSLANASSIVLGGVSGLLEAWGGNSNVLNRMFGSELVEQTLKDKGSLGAVRLFTTALKQLSSKEVAQEGIQEMAQEFLGVVNELVADPNKKDFAFEDFKRILNAGAAGVVGGLGGVGVSTSFDFVNANVAGFSDPLEEQQKQITINAKNLDELMGDPTLDIENKPLNRFLFPDDAIAFYEFYKNADNRILNNYFENLDQLEDIKTRVTQERFTEAGKLLNFDSDKIKTADDPRSEFLDQAVKLFEVPQGRLTGIPDKVILDIAKIPDAGPRRVAVLKATKQLIEKRMVYSPAKAMEISSPAKRRLNKTSPVHQDISNDINDRVNALLASINNKIGVAIVPEIINNTNKFLSQPATALLAEQVMAEQKRILQSNSQTSLEEELVKQAKESESYYHNVANSSEATNIVQMNPDVKSAIDSSVQIRQINDDNFSEQIDDHDSTLVSSSPEVDTVTKQFDSVKSNKDVDSNHEEHFKKSSVRQADQLNADATEFREIFGSESLYPWFYSYFTDPHGVPFDLMHKDYQDGNSFLVKWKRNEYNIRREIKDYLDRIYTNQNGVIDTKSIFGFFAKYHHSFKNKRMPNISKVNSDGDLNQMNNPKMLRYIIDKIDSIFKIHGKLPFVSKKANAYNILRDFLINELKIPIDIANRLNYSTADGLLENYLINPSVKLETDYARYAFAHELIYGTIFAVPDHRSFNLATGNQEVGWFSNNYLFEAISRIFGKVDTNNTMIINSFGVKDSVTRTEDNKTWNSLTSEQRLKFKLDLFNNKKYMYTTQFGDKDEAVFIKIDKHTFPVTQEMLDEYNQGKFKFFDTTESVSMQMIDDFNKQNSSKHSNALFKFYQFQFYKSLFNDYKTFDSHQEVLKRLSLVLTYGENLEGINMLNGFNKEVLEDGSFVYVKNNASANQIEYLTPDGSITSVYEDAIHSPDSSMKDIGDDIKIAVLDIPALDGDAWYSNYFATVVDQFLGSRLSKTNPHKKRLSTIKAHIINKDMEIKPNFRNIEDDNGQTAHNELIRQILASGADIVVTEKDRKYNSKFHKSEIRNIEGHNVEFTTIKGKDFYISQNLEVNTQSSQRQILNQMVSGNAFISKRSGQRVALMNQISSRMLADTSFSENFLNLAKLLPKDDKFRTIPNERWTSDNQSSPFLTEEYFSLFFHKLMSLNPFKTRRVRNLDISEDTSSSDVLKPRTNEGDNKYSLAWANIGVSDTGSGTVREALEVKDIQEAKQIIWADPLKYQDMFEFTEDGGFNPDKIKEWEIVEYKNKMYIPGEIFIGSRVPADNLQSHSALRVFKVDRSGAGFFRVAHEVAKNRGSDSDGDHTYLDLMYKDKEGRIILDDSDKGLMNRYLNLFIADFEEGDNDTQIGLDIGNTTKTIREHFEGNKPNLAINTMEYSQTASDAGLASQQLIGIAANSNKLMKFIFGNKISLGVNASRRFGIADVYFDENGKRHLIGISRDFGKVHQASNETKEMMALNEDLISEYIGSGLLNIILDDIKHLSVREIGLTQSNLAIVQTMMMFQTGFTTPKQVLNKLSEVIQYVNYQQSLGKQSSDYYKSILKLHGQMNRVRKVLDVAFMNKLDKVFHDRTSFQEQYNKMNDVVNNQAFLYFDTNDEVIRNVVQMFKNVGGYFDKHVFSKEAHSLITNDKTMYEFVLSDVLGIEIPHTSGGYINYSDLNDLITYKVNQIPTSLRWSRVFNKSGSLYSFIKPFEMSQEEIKAYQDEFASPKMEFFRNALIAKHYIGKGNPSWGRLISNETWQSYDKMATSKIADNIKDLSVETAYSTASFRLSDNAVPVRQVKTLLDRLSTKFNIEYFFVEDLDHAALFRDGKIYFNPKMINWETSFHEFMHPFVDAILSDNPELFRSLTQEIDDILNNPDSEKQIFAERLKSHLDTYQFQNMTDKYKEAITFMLGKYASTTFQAKEGIDSDVMWHFKKMLEDLWALINELMGKLLNQDVVRASDFDAKNTTLEMLGGFMGIYQERVDLTPDRILNMPDDQKNIQLLDTISRDISAEHIEVDNFMADLDVKSQIVVRSYYLLNEQHKRYASLIGVDPSVFAHAIDVYRDSLNPAYSNYYQKASNLITRNDFAANVLKTISIMKSSSMWSEIQDYIEEYNRVYSEWQTFIQKNKVLERMGYEYSNKDKSSYYVPHIYDFNTTKDGETPQAPDTFFALSTARGLKQDIPLFEAINDGTKLKFDGGPSLMLAYKLNVLRVAENQKMIDEGLNSGLFTKIPTENMRVVNVANFLARDKSEIYAPIPVAKFLENLLNKSWFESGSDLKQNMWKYFQKSVFMIKYLNLGMGLFHANAFLRSYYLASEKPSFNLKNVINEGNDAWNSMAPIVELLVRAGLTGDTYFKDLSFTQGEDQRFKSFVKQSVPFKIFGRFQNLLFDRFGRGLKVSAAMKELQKKLTDANLDLESDSALAIAKEVASAVNKDFGGLNYDRMGMSRVLHKILQVSFLGADWTLSNFLVFKGAFQKDGAIFRQMLQRVLFRGGIATLLANLLFALWPDDDDDDRDVLERFKDNFDNAYRQGKLYWLDVDLTNALGMKDDRQAYFSIVGHWKDWLNILPEFDRYFDKDDNYFETVGPTVQFLFHKSSTPLKIFIETALGRDIFGREFTTYDEYAGEYAKGPKKHLKGKLFKNRQTKFSDPRKRLAQMYSISQHAFFSAMPFSYQSLQNERNTVENNFANIVGFGLRTPTKLSERKYFKRPLNEDPLHGQFLDFVRDMLSNTKQTSTPIEMDLPNIKSNFQKGVKRFSEFAVYFDEKRKIPVAVVENIRGGATSTIRSNRFFKDFDLKSAIPKFLKSFFSDRGHLAARSDMRTQKGANESFNTANIIAMSSAFNRDAWNKLERKVQALAEKSEVVKVVTGPVLNDWLLQKIDEGVTVPRRVFKVIQYKSKEDNNWYHFGVLMNNNSREKFDESNIVPISKLEKITGLKFDIIKNSKYTGGK